MNLFEGSGLSCAPDVTINRPYPLGGRFLDVIKLLKKSAMGLESSRRFVPRSHALGAQ
jgi:hypothetical protein